MALVRGTGSFLKVSLHTCSSFDQGSVKTSLDSNILEIFSSVKKVKGVRNVPSHSFEMRPGFFSTH